MCCTFLLVIVAALTLCGASLRPGVRALGWASRRPPPRAARSCCAWRRTAATASARPEIRTAPCSPASWPSACTRPAWTILTEGGHQLQQGGLARARRADDGGEFTVVDGQAHPP